MRGFWEKEAKQNSWQTITEQVAAEYGIEFGKSFPLSTGPRILELYDSEAPDNWLLREQVG